MEKVHILNGDSLAGQLNNLINEPMIVARECMISGNVQGRDIREIFANRAKFIAQYPDTTEQDYYQKAVLEFEKIMQLTTKHQVYCWFEEDLFCQTNLWFVMYVLQHYSQVTELYLVKPNQGNEYSFAHMTPAQLLDAYQQAIPVTQSMQNALVQLWRGYQQQDFALMYQCVKQLKDSLPFIEQAVVAEQRRQPDETGLGYPERKLLSLMQQLGTDNFAQVFKAFSATEAIYSFGDIQVLQMFEQLKARIEIND